MPLHLNPEPSRRLQLFTVAVHGLAGVAALANPLPLWVRLTLLAAVWISAYRSLRHQRNPEVRGLVLGDDGEWQILRRSGAVPAALAETTVATPWLVLLHLTTADGKIALPICRDSVDQESFRRLRVILRCRRSTASRSDGA